MDVSIMHNPNSAIEIMDFLVANGIYPMTSKRGKIFFKSPQRGLLTEDKARAIIEQLKIKTKKDCEKIRDEIRNRRAALRESRPIKGWIKEERPREMLIEYGPESLPLSKLLAILLRIGKEGTSAEELSKRLLNKFGTLRRIVWQQSLKFVK